MDFPCGSVLNGSGFGWNLLVDWWFRQSQVLVLREAGRKATVQMNKQAGTSHYRATVSDSASPSGIGSVCCRLRAGLTAPFGNIFSGGAK